MSINQISSAVSRIAGAAAVAGTSSTAEPRVMTKDARKSPDAKASLVDDVSNPISDAELKKSVEMVNRFLNANNSVNLNVDQETGKVLVQIVDKETNTIIRQIPSREVIEMAKDLDKKNGMLIREQA